MAESQRQWNPLTSHTQAEKLCKISTASQEEPHPNLTTVPLVLTQLHRCYPKMDVLPTQTATSQEIAELLKADSKDVTISTLFTQ